jgi:hypothetical protein
MHDLAEIRSQVAKAFWPLELVLMELIEVESSAAQSLITIYREQGSACGKWGIGKKRTPYSMNGVSEAPLLSDD